MNLPEGLTLRIYLTSEKEQMVINTIANINIFLYFSVVKNIGLQNLLFNFTYSVVLFLNITLNIIIIKMSSKTLKLSPVIQK